MSLSAEIFQNKDRFIAELSDGRRLEQPNYFRMAEALFQEGVKADHLCFDWRNGTRMITAGTQAALAAEIRQLGKASCNLSHAA